MEPVTGIEPVINAWKALVLPLHQTDMASTVRFELTTNGLGNRYTIHCATSSGTSGRSRTRNLMGRNHLHYPLCYRRLEVHVGVEPTSRGFADLCLTVWLMYRGTDDRIRTYTQQFRRLLHFHCASSVWPQRRDLNPESILRRDR